MLQCLCLHLCASRAIFFAHLSGLFFFNVLINWLPTFFHETFPSGRVSHISPLFRLERLQLPFQVLSGGAIFCVLTHWCHWNVAYVTCTSMHPGTSHIHPPVWVCTGVGCLVLVLIPKSSTSHGSRMIMLQYTIDHDSVVYVFNCVSSKLP